ncbi:MAG: hypothetical protein AVDCRST_MAG34-1604, partial [uncultured Nocardioidaceae bacterium]
DPGGRHVDRLQHRAGGQPLRHAGPAAHPRDPRLRRRGAGLAAVERARPRDRAGDRRAARHGVRQWRARRDGRGVRDLHPAAAPCRPDRLHGHRRADAPHRPRSRAVPRLPDAGRDPAVVAARAGLVRGSQPGSRSRPRTPAERGTPRWPGRSLPGPRAAAAGSRPRAALRPARTAAARTAAARSGAARTAPAWSGARSAAVRAAALRPSLRGAGSRAAGTRPARPRPASRLPARLRPAGLRVDPRACAPGPGQASGDGDRRVGDHLGRRRAHGGVDAALPAGARGQQRRLRGGVRERVPQHRGHLQRRPGHGTRVDRRGGCPRLVDHRHRPRGAGVPAQQRRAHRPRGVRGDDRPPQPARDHERDLDRHAPHGRCHAGPALHRRRQRVVLPPGRPLRRGAVRRARRPVGAAAGHDAGRASQALV